MPSLPSDYQQVATLLNDCTDGQATEDQRHKLNELLLEDKALRQYAARWLINEVLLHRETRPTGKPDMPLRL